MHMQKIHLLYASNLRHKAQAHWPAQWKNGFCNQFVSGSHTVETGSPSRCGCVGVWYLFWITLGSRSQVFLSDSHTLRHLRHVEAVRTSKRRFRWAFPRCGGDLDSGPHPPSTNYTAPMSRYEVIPAQVCRRETQIFINMLKDCIFRNLAECLRKRKKIIYDSAIRVSRWAIDLIVL